MRWSKIGCALTIALAASGGRASALEPLTGFGDNPGELDAYVHVPAADLAGAPLVVALHGCTQSAADVDDETGLAALAETTPFLLLLPQQRAANNEARCFNFFRADDNRPGVGESGSIRNMIAHALDRWSLDRARVYVAGLSAGGSMTAVLLANYPTLVAGGGVIAGTPFDCNRPTWRTGAVWWWLDTFVGEAEAASWACGIGGPSVDDRAPADWGDAVRAVAGEPAPGAWPSVSLWQGGADTVVDPDNQRELLEQWTDVHGVDRAAESQETVGDAVRRTYADADGRAVVETWWLEPLPHAWPVDPEACGVADTYSVPSGVCASRRMLRFWGLVP